MNQEERQPLQASPSEKCMPPVQLPEPSEEETDHSVFPHFLLCVPVALVMCWQFYDLFGGRFFFYKIGVTGTYGTADIFGPAWLLMPLLFAALLFFAFWNMRFARESGDNKAQALRQGMLTMVGVFVVTALIVWLLILNVQWK